MLSCAYMCILCVCVSKGRVWLIDLNPFGEVTDSLLFSWEELTSGEITQQQVGLCFMWFFGGVFFSHKVSLYVN